MNDIGKDRANGKNGGSIVVREMELEDLTAVYQLGEKLFTAEKWPTLYRTWDKYEVVELFASDGETCLVAEVDEEVVGFALGTLIEKTHSAWDYGYLLWLGVDPDRGRKGMANKLLARLTEIFVENGARMILVDTDPDNLPALGFFRREGFGQEQRHVFLSKNLTHDPAYVKHRARNRSRRAATRRPSATARSND